MTRSLVPWLLAGALFCPRLASADVAPSPTVLHVEGERSMVTVRGGPDHAMYRLRNRADQVIEVFFFRAILRVDGTNVPMEVTDIHTDAGRAEGRTVRVPANGELRVTVFFDLPDRYASRREWDVGLRVTADGPGGWEVSPAHITRGRREPMRARKWITGPKDPGTTPRAARR